MATYKALPIILGIFAITVGDLAFAQDYDEADMDALTNISNEPKNISKQLSLKGVIEEGLRENSDEKIRNYTFELLDIKWQDAYESFWYPNVAVVMSTGDHNVDRLKTAHNHGSSQTTTNKAPKGYVGLQLGEYTVFNWGKDYLAYLNKKYKTQREKDNLKVKKRQLKFQLIDQYFNLARTKEKLDIKRDQLRQASFIYRFTRQKAALGKVSRQTYYEARSEFLKSQAEYHEAMVMVVGQENNMASILGEKSKVHYQVPEYLNFIELKLTVLEAQEFAMVQNIAILNSKLELDNANRTYKIAKKENLPLPKFSVNLGTYKKNLSNDSAQTSFETHSGNSNIEVIASINMTWNVWGEGGFFNSRRNKKAFVNKQISEIRFNNAHKQVRIKVESLHNSIKHLERQYQVALLRKKTARKSFDTTLENYLDSKAKFVELQAQLESLYDSQIYLENTKYAHMIKKLELADTIGLEDFPSENFEALALRKEKL